MFKFFLLAALLVLFLPACSAFPSANPTPLIIVVTATPDATRAPVVTFFTPTPSPTARATQAAANETPRAVDTATLNLKPTDVKYVRAKQDINIRKGPGTNFEIVGGVYAGQTAQVTGYKSADDGWWRVVCPVDNVTDCWVSADPALTETTDAPSVAPTGTADVNIEAFTRQLATAFQNKNYDALRQMMGDPFTIGYWRSEGTTPTRDEALVLIKNWTEPANEIVIDLAGKTDQTKLLAGTNPLTMWDPKIKIAQAVYVTGLANRTETLLIIAQRADDSLYWYGMLVAGNGGFEAMNR